MLWKSASEKGNILTLFTDEQNNIVDPFEFLGKKLQVECAIEITGFLVMVSGPMLVMKLHQVKILEEGNIIPNNKRIFL